MNNEQKTNLPVISKSISAHLFEKGSMTGKDGYIEKSKRYVEILRKSFLFLIKKLQYTGKL